MSESTGLDGSSTEIQLGFVEREATPHELVQSRTSTIRPNCHIRILFLP